MINRAQTWVCGFMLTLGLWSYGGAAEFRQVTLQVDGMTSPTCPVLLKSAVSKIKGVKRVDASLASHSATIEYDEHQTNLDQIRDAIEFQAGFGTEMTE